LEEYAHPPPATKPNVQVDTKYDYNNVPQQSNAKKMVNLKTWSSAGWIEGSWNDKWVGQPGSEWFVT